MSWVTVQIQEILSVWLFVTQWCNWLISCSICSFSIPSEACPHFLTYFAHSRPLSPHCTILLVHSLGHKAQALRRCQTCSDSLCSRGPLLRNYLKWDHLQGRQRSTLNQRQDVSGHVGHGQLKRTDRMHGFAHRYMMVRRTSAGYLSSVFAHWLV